MTQWVVFFILSEHDVEVLNEFELLNDFASCTRYSLFDGIKEYIEYSENETVKELLKRAYSDKFKYYDYKSDKSTLELLDRIKQYNTNVEYGKLSIPQLERILDDISRVFDDTSTLVTEKKSTTDSIGIKKSVNIDSIIGDLSAIYRNTNRKDILDMCSRFSKIKDTCFTTKEQSSSMNNLLSKIHKEVDDLVLIRDGVSYILSKLKSGFNPSYWRSI